MDNFRYIIKSQRKILALVREHASYQEDSYRSIENHVYIAASVFCAFIGLLGIYVIASLTVLYGEMVMMKEYTYREQLPIMIIFGASVLLAISISAICIYFIQKVKDSMVRCLEKSHIQRKKAFQRYAAEISSEIHSN